MSHPKALRLIILLIFMPICAYAADITGTWSATFDTQIGQQNYTYDFKVDGTTLTGAITTANGEATLADGKVEGNTVTFTENLNYQGQALVITYKGEIVSVDEISFVRNVVGTDEKLTAKRSK
jgi:hypothetical protein